MTTKQIRKLRRIPPEDMQWSWGGWRKNGDPMACGLELLKMEERGEITAEAVLRRAQHKNSAFHPCITWNQTAAAEKCRLDEAADLLQSLRVVVVEGHKASKAFFRVVTSPDPKEESVATGYNRKGKYLFVIGVMSSKSTRNQVVEQALSDLRAWRDRYQGIKELADIFEALDGKL